MHTNKPFGRRAPPRPASPPPVHKVRIENSIVEEPPAPTAILGPASEPAPAVAAGPPTPTVEQEVEEWNAARKIRKRSFREPWRSVSLAAGLGFMATSWMLPEDVAGIAEAALAVLTIGSIYAGWRRPKTG